MEGLVESLGYSSEALVCAQVYRVDVVQIQSWSGDNGFEGLRNVAFSETSEFPVVALWTLEVKAVFSLFGFLVAPDAVAASEAGAFVDVRLFAESFALFC